MKAWRPEWLLTAASLAALLPGASCSSASPSSGTPISGFVVTIETTKCKLGSGVRIEHKPGDTVWVGSDGLFDVDLANQSSFCLATWDPVKGPDAATEIAEVKQYFLGLGMSFSQMGPVTTTYASAANGASFINAVIGRVVDGIPVHESVAWAGLVAGQSLGETVYWPDLPASVSEELTELQAIVSDPAKLAAYQSKLPAGFVTGSLVIHHTDRYQRVSGHPAAEFPLVAHACYDAAISQDGLGMTRCYLSDGSEFTFPPP